MTKETKRRGSTKIMTPVTPGTLSMQFTDLWSVFDCGASEQPIPYLGAARCAVAVRVFELLREAGISTHFIEQVDETTIFVQEHRLPHEDNTLSGNHDGTVTPLKWLIRGRLFGLVWMGYR